MSTAETPSGSEPQPPEPDPSTQPQPATPAGSEPEPEPQPAPPPAEERRKGASEWGFLARPRAPRLIVLVLTAIALAAPPYATADNPLLVEYTLDAGGTIGDEISETWDTTHTYVMSVWYATPVQGRFGGAFHTGEFNWVNGGVPSPEHLTAMIWVKAAQSPGLMRYVISRGSGPGCAPASYGLYTSTIGSVNAGGLEFYVNHAGTVYTAPGVPPAKVWDGQWHMAAGTFDGSTVRFYLDGEQIGNGTAVPGPINYDVGSSFDLAGYGVTHLDPCAPSKVGFVGSFDDFRLYNRALTDGEVVRLADFGGSTPPPPLAFYAPTVHTTGADQITPGAARILGTVDDDNDQALYHVEYGKTTAYGKSSGTFGLPAAVGAQSVHVALAGLDPDTTYHARLVALNSGGTGHGEDITFHTTGTPIVRFTANEFSAPESASLGQLTVERAGSTTQATTFHITTADGSAHAGSDYTATAGVLSFAAGEATKTISVPIHDDPDDEPDETLTVTLSDPGTGLGIGEPHVATLTITDNDLPPDTAPPTTTINLDPASPNAGDYYTGLVAVSVTATDDRPGEIQTRCTFDPDAPFKAWDEFVPEQCDKPFQLGALGTHTIYAISRDASGNTGPVVTRSFRIFGEPDTQITSGPSGQTLERRPQFKFTSTIPGSTFVCAIDGSSFAPCGNPWTVGPLTVGNHSFQVRAISPDGIEDPTPAQRSFRLEATDSLACGVNPVIRLLQDSCSAGARGECHPGGRGPCEEQTLICPIGTVCTLTLTAEYAGSDRYSSLEWAAGVVAMYSYRIRKKLSARTEVIKGECIIRRGRCATTDPSAEIVGNTSGRVLGDNRSLFLECHVRAAYRFPPENLHGPDTSRRIRCRVDVKIEPAAPLALVSIGSVLQVAAPGPGLLTVSAPGIARVQTPVRAEGPVALNLKLSGSARRQFRERSRVRLSLNVKFAGQDGSTLSKRAPVTLRGR